MKITTWNVNGLRAALRKGFAEHLRSIDPTVLLLQEVRALPEQLPLEFQQPRGWHVIWNPAERPGYSGTAIWSRFPIEVHSLQVAGRHLDQEGRLIEATTGGLRVACVYLPSGSSGPDRQAVKDRWLSMFRRWLDSRRHGEPLVFGGDINVAHTEKDIFHAKSNESTSGFLPHERAWMGRLLRAGWHDLIREHHGDVHGPYSWWSNRGRARELDRGWRIDYLCCNAAARPRFRSAAVSREAALEVSDHAPVSVEFD